MQSKEAVALSLVLCFCAVTAMALVTRFLVHKHAKSPPTTDQDVSMADGSIERQRQLVSISSSWKRLFASGKQEQNKGHWAPTLSAIIKAGDEGVFSAALFNSLPGHPGHIPVDVLYEAFAAELRARSMTERSAYPSELSKFLAGTKKSVPGLGRAKSVSHRAPSSARAADVSPRRQRMSLDLSAAERALPRSMSMKRPAPALVSMGRGLHRGVGSSKPVQQSWMKDGQSVELIDGKMSIKITSAELAALSLVLGSPVSVVVDGASLKKGAFNISITATPTENGKRMVSLRQHKRSISQQHAKGSGFSPLFAKHFAAGSLPFSQDKSTVNSILITNDSLEAIQLGAPLYTHPAAARTPEARFLSSLPSSRTPNIHILAASTEKPSSATLIDAIAALPFVGGLPPLASAPLIRTVQFISSGGLPPARLLQRLEGLIDKIHRQSPHLKIFGPLYEPQNARLQFRERERLGKLATDPAQPDLASEKAARVSRYITLLERLMGLVPDMKPQDVLATVREATKLELRRSYADAVAAFANNSISATPSYLESRTPASDEGNRKRLSTVSTTSPNASPSARRSDRSSTVSMLTVNSVASPASSDTFPFPRENLSTRVEQVLKTEAPFSIETVAFVARMVLVAWTLSVESVAWGEEGGLNVRVGGAEGEKMVLC